MSKRYLLEDYRGLDKGSVPKFSVIGDKELFDLLQGKPNGIAISEVSEYCLIDWS